MLYGNIVDKVENEARGRADVLYDWWNVEVREQI